MPSRRSNWSSAVRACHRPTKSARRRQAAPGRRALSAARWLPRPQSMPSQLGANVQDDPPVALRQLVDESLDEARARCWCASRVWAGRTAATALRSTGSSGCSSSASAASHRRAVFADGVRQRAHVAARVARPGRRPAAGAHRSSSTSDGRRGGAERRRQIDRHALSGRDSPRHRHRDDAASRPRRRSAALQRHRLDRRRGRLHVQRSQVRVGRQDRLVDGSRLRVDRQHRTAAVHASAPRPGSATRSTERSDPVGRAASRTASVRRCRLQATTTASPLAPLDQLAGADRRPGTGPRPPGLQRHPAPDAGAAPTPGRPGPSARRSLGGCRTGNSACEAHGLGDLAAAAAAAMSSSPVRRASASWRAWSGVTASVTLAMGPRGPVTVRASNARAGEGRISPDLEHLRALEHLRVLRLVAGFVGDGHQHLDPVAGSQAPSTALSGARGS